MSVNYNSAKAFLLAACGLALIAGSAVARPLHRAATALPPPADTQRMTYTLFAGGIAVGTGRLTLSSDGAGHYRAAIDGDDSGALAQFVPWNGHFESKGLRPKAGVAMPQVYTSETAGRGGHEIKQFTWTRAGAPVVFKDTRNGQDITPQIPPSLSTGAVDPLSVTVAMLDGIAHGRNCSGSRDLFDGLRRFRVTLHPATAEVLPDSPYNVFSGKASPCAIEITPEAGKWPRKPHGWQLIQEQGRRRGSLPTVWAARLDRDGPAVPVRMRIVTAYGTLYLQLTHYQHE